MYIFISHSSKDFEIAEKVCDYLEKNGHKCFLAPRDIRSGQVYAQELVEAIDRSDVILVLLSKAANESPHVLREIERAVSKKIAILVYRLEEVELSKSLEYFLMTHQWINVGEKEPYKDILKSINICKQETLGFTDNHSEKSKKSKKKPRWFLCCLLCIILLVGVFLGGYYYQKASLQEANTSVNSQEVLAPGDTIIFGTYLNEPIEWRVLKVSTDGREAVIVAGNILTMKAFDAAEGGKYNNYEGTDYWGKSLDGEPEELQQKLRGSNSWSESNIRCWLNATAENVEYTDGVPNTMAMSELKNGYDKEPGFLSYFTKEEQEDILETELTTDGVVTKDKVFLLSKAELQWFYEANVSVQAIPTEAAKIQDTAKWYETYALEYGVEDYYWWLRDAEGLNPYEAFIVCNGLNDAEYRAETVGLEGYGIRPAMKIKTDSAYIQKR